MSRTTTSIQCIYMLYYFFYIYLPYFVIPSTLNLLHLLSTTFHLDRCLNQVSICGSFYTMGQVGPVNGMMPMGASKPQSTTPVSSTPSKSAKEYDFSSLTQGMFAKQ